jgi:hypothetical protein
MASTGLHADILQSVSLGSTIIIALAAIAASAVSQRAIKWSRGPATARVPTLEDRLDQLSKTMKESAQLLEQVSSEIAARALAAERIKEEAYAAERLAAFNDEAREAVARLVRSEVKADSRHMFRLGLLANAGFFLFGVLATITVALLIHPLK